MRVPENRKYVLFGGAFVLANKLQYVADRQVEGLSTKQWFLLRNLRDLPQEPLPTISQLAGAMDSTRQNVAQMLDVLERQGLVAIEQSFGDRRSRCVRMTQAGLARAMETAENAQGFLEGLHEGISPQDLETAGAVVIRMIQNLEKMQEGLKE